MRDNIQGGALTETTFLILLAFYSPRHGYGAMQWIAQSTGNRVRLGAGTLYGAMRAMEHKGWIEPLEGEKGNRRAYQITPSGKAALGAELKRIKQIQLLANATIKEEL